MKKIFQKIMGTLIVTAMVINVVSAAYASSSISSQKSEINQKIQETKESLNEVNSQKAESEDKVEELSGQIGSYESQISSLESEIEEKTN